MVMVRSRVKCWGWLKYVFGQTYYRASAPDPVKNYTEIFS